MSIQILISIKGHNSVKNKPKMSDGLYLHVDGIFKIWSQSTNFCQDMDWRNDFDNNQG